jgi:hypothetical protein
MYGAYCAGAALQWTQHEVPRQPQVLIILALFGISIAAGALVFVDGYYWRWSSAKVMVLDEREVAARDRVFSSAYRWIAGVSLVGCFAWQAGWNPTHPLSVDSNVIFWGYMWLLATLPAALLAWTERTDTRSDDAPA